MLLHLVDCFLLDVFGVGMGCEIGELGRVFRLERLAAGYAVLVGCCVGCLFVGGVVGMGYAGCFGCWASNALGVGVGNMWGFCGVLMGSLCVTIVPVVSVVEFLVMLLVCLVLG
ncbi:hypothetical protein Tco_0803550 [Tanacetum coccineum]|uniref:NADH dehydrogenase subunit 6 n=1 Tax=Tanacetum coccineum TaxID=301880 RepID=A0ABQ5A602_9ASTR